MEGIFHPLHFFAFTGESIVSDTMGFPRLTEGEISDYFKVLAANVRRGE